MPTVFIRKSNTGLCCRTLKHYFWLIGGGNTHPKQSRRRVVSFNGLHCIATPILDLNVTYSFKLKRLPLLDVTTLAGLHTLRLGMGIVLSYALLPGSLVFAASLSFLSLALAKRYSEIINRGIKYSAITSGRGYFATDANIALAVGVGSALVATQVTVFYLLETLPAEMLSRTTLLWPIPVLLCIWLVRVWLFANRGQLNEDLAMFALRELLRRLWLFAWRAPFWWRQ